MSAARDVPELRCAGCTDDQEILRLRYDFTTHDSRRYDAGRDCFILINPEIAVHYANYERNFRILNHLKTCFLSSALAVDIGLWVQACFFLLKSKKQSCNLHRAECGRSPKAWRLWGWWLFST